MKKNQRYFLAALVVVFTGMLIAGMLFPGETGRMIAQAKEDAIKVFINKKESKIVPVQTDKNILMPINFPVEQGEQTWEVKTKYDPKTKTLNVTVVNKKREVRGDRIKCNACGGSGDCQACYPSGSGRNIQGNACPTCNGTGKCFICNGDGSY